MVYKSEVQAKLMEIDDLDPHHPSTANNSVLGYNLLFDQSQCGIDSVRHPIFGYSESTPWPPASWTPGTICCWNCTQLLHDPPVPVPHTRDAARERFSVYGFFCSWSCAKRYLIETQPCACSEKILLLEQLAHSFGFHDSKIVAAPPRHCLKKFGGDLSPRAFQEEAAKGICRVLHTPPLLNQALVYARGPNITEKMQSLSVPSWTRPVKERVLTQAAMQGSESLLSVRLPAAQEAEGSGMYAQFIERHGLQLPAAKRAQTPPPRPNTGSQSSGSRPEGPAPRNFLTLGSLTNRQES